MSSTTWGAPPESFQDFRKRLLEELSTPQVVKEFCFRIYNPRTGKVDCLTENELADYWYNGVYPERFKRC